MAFADFEVELVVPPGNPYSGTYQFALGKCTGLDDLACKRSTGYTLLGLAQASFGDDIGMQLIFAAVIVWLYRTKNGFGHTTFEQVAAAMPWSTEIDLHDPPPPSNDEDDETGKASASVDTSATSDF